MKIGFISQWNESGHSYVTKNFVDALSEEHECFILATQGVKDNKIEDSGIWSGYNVTPIQVDYFSVTFQQVKAFIEENDLDALFFNEWYDWDIVISAREMGVKILGYLDWFNKSFIEKFRRYYDALIISGEHAYEVFFRFPNAHFVPWGVDTNLFQPREQKEALFFHSAGWGGINNRKCTPQIVKAAEKERTSLYLHTQTPVYPDQTCASIKRMRDEGLLKVHLGRVSHPGLYYKGRVYAGISKLEGLGLYFPEALASGLPILTTDALPMKQWITEDTGWTVPVKRTQPRGDGYYFHEKIVSDKDLQEKMREIADTPLEELKRRGNRAREYAEQYHSFEQFKENVNKIIERL